MDSNHLNELLSASLPACADRSQLHKAVRDLQELTQFLATTLATAQKSILALRAENLQMQEDLLAAGVQHTGGTQSELIGFEEPKLIIPGKDA